MPNHSIDLMVKKHANRYLRQLNAKNLSDFSIPDQSHKRLLSVYADGERAVPIGHRLHLRRAAIVEQDLLDLRPQRVGGHRGRRLPPKEAGQRAGQSFTVHLVADMRRCREDLRAARTISGEEAIS